jgi:hypothetical protein
MTARASWWLRIGLSFMALIELVTGVWAVVDPSGWYADFPGFGRHWVSANGPFNHHLTVDAGAGFLAVGVLLLVAAVRLDRRAVQLSLVALLVHEVPHLLYHLAHTPAALSGGDVVLGAGGLAFEVALGAVLLALVTRTRALESQ